MSRDILDALADIVRDPAQHGPALLSPEDLLACLQPPPRVREVLATRDRRAINVLLDAEPTDEN